MFVFICQTLKSFKFWVRFVTTNLVINRITMLNYGKNGFDPEYKIIYQCIRLNKTDDKKEGDIVISWSNLCTGYYNIPWKKETLREQSDKKKLCVWDRVPKGGGGDMTKSQPVEVNWKKGDWPSPNNLLWNRRNIGNYFWNVEYKVYFFNPTSNLLW